jgi:hypothetical protein
MHLGWFVFDFLLAVLDVSCGGLGALGRMSSTLSP